MLLRHVCGLSTLLLVFGFSISAEAGVKTKGNKREASQQYRIKKGVESGKLTKKETKKLAKQQKRVDLYQRKIASDGTVTKKERLKLHRKQAHANRSIYRQKHDKQNKWKENEWKGKKKAPSDNDAAGAKARLNQEISDAQALTIEE